MADIIDKEETLSNTIDSIAPERLDAMKENMFKSLEESGSMHLEAATKFQAGLDKVTDVLLILVLKFGRATTFLIVVGIINIVVLTINVIATVNIAALRSEVRDLMDRQEEFARSQKRIEKTTVETKQDVASTNQKVAETQAKVDTAVETAPKVEIDARTGKAKLVVSVPVKKPQAPKAMASGAPTPPAPSTSSKKFDLKIE